MALAREGREKQQVLQQEVPLLAGSLPQGVLPRVVPVRPRVVPLAGQEALRGRVWELEGPLQRQVPQVRGLEPQLLGWALGRKFLQQEPVLRGLLRRCRLLREPAQRQPRRCHLRRPEFLQ